MNRQQGSLYGGWASPAPETEKPKPEKPKQEKPKPSKAEEAAPVARIIEWKFLTEYLDQHQCGSCLAWVEAKCVALDKGRTKIWLCQECREKPWYQ